LESDIQLLELADGIKDALINSGFLTINSVINSSVTDISSKLGVDFYLAQIIFKEAKRAAAKMTKASSPLDTDIVTPAAIAIKKEEL
jgi:hypothetical protein